MALQIRTHSFNPLPWFIIFTFGVLLVAMAVPGLVSLYTAHSASRLVSDLTNFAKEPSQSEYEAAMKRFEVASKYELGRRQHFNDQAALLLALYYKQKSIRKEIDAIRSLAKAGLVITRSLKLGPGNANYWYLLAEIRTLQGKMDRKTRRFLNMSYLSGPREGWVALRRLPFSLRYWLLLDNDLRRHVKREIAILWFSPRYQRALIEQFSNSSIRGQKIIFAQIKSFGDEEVQKFLKYTKSVKWKFEL